LDVSEGLSSAKLAMDGMSRHVKMNNRSILPWENCKRMA
jgi:hypothetical protein